MCMRCITNDACDWANKNSKYWFKTLFCDILWLYWKVCHEDRSVCRNMRLLLGNIRRMNLPEEEMKDICIVRNRHRYDLVIWFVHAVFLLVFLFFACMFQYFSQDFSRRRITFWTAIFSNPFEEIHVLRIWCVPVLWFFQSKACYFVHLFSHTFTSEICWINL